MKIINSKKELEDFVGYDIDDAYDVDANWVICEMEYKYPILVECVGWDIKGLGYKIRTKDDLEELKKFLQ